MIQTQDRIRTQRRVRERPFQEEVFPIIEESTASFFNAIGSYGKFHALSLLVIVSEILLFGLLYTLHPDFAVMAIGISALFFTFFAYLTLRVHLWSKKGDQLEHVRDCFVLMCQEQLVLDHDEMENHTSLCYGLRKFVEALNGKEDTMVQLPPFLTKLFVDFNRLSRWWFWYDFFKMKELLLQTVVVEHIEMVKRAPNHLDIHASLANAYILLANLYSEGMSWFSEGKLWKRKEYAIDWVRQKFRQVNTSAIEEYKILLEYAPNDPWIHAQLGCIYRELDMRRQEVAEYETIVKLRPTDLESLFHLGTLYFAEGHVAKGLQIYESLKKMDEPLASELMVHYGSHLYR